MILREAAPGVEGEDTAQTSTSPVMGNSLDAKPPFSYPTGASYVSVRRSGGAMSVDWLYSHSAQNTLPSSCKPPVADRPPDLLTVDAPDFTPKSLYPLAAPTASAGAGTAAKAESP